MEEYPVKRTTKDSNDLKVHRLLMADMHMRDNLISRLRVMDSTAEPRQFLKPTKHTEWHGHVLPVTSRRDTVPQPPYARTQPPTTTPILPQFITTANDKTTE
jgi:hypothetical protein